MITRNGMLSVLFGGLMFLFLLQSATFAGSDAPADRDLVRPSKAAATANRFPTRKLGRGFSNVLLGVIEIPKSMISINKEYGSAAGLTWGFFLGVKRFLLREVVGVYEICTFWFRQGTIIEPEFPFMPEERIEWRVQDPSAQKSVLGHKL
ncbi:MAG: exosortase system-associated protein, TIGR04073 family [Lentisphaerae bacterium]|nr:MAG: exosortase system-associated protein, TIGR04073 family [Lentisphaerota bacterium]